MISTVLYRLLYMLGVMVAVVTIVFAMIHMSGDPLDALVPPGSSPEDVQVLREKYGLDESLANQYVRFLSNAARGDFGLSWRFDEPARDVVFDRLPATLELVGLSFGLALLIAIPLGVVAGARPGRLTGGMYYGLSLFGQAVPAFWLGTILILVFAVRLDWVPSSGRDGAGSLVLPVVTLAAYPAAVLRMVRASVQEAMSQDLVRTARAKGLPEQVVMFVHVLRNAAAPVVAMRVCWPVSLPARSWSSGCLPIRESASWRCNRLRAVICRCAGVRDRDRVPDRGCESGGGLLDSAHRSPGASKWLASGWKEPVMAIVPATRQLVTWEGFRESSAEPPARRRRRPLPAQSTIGLLIGAVVVLFAVAGPWLVDAGPDQQNLGERLAKPVFLGELSIPLAPTSLGVDLWVRMAVGARLSPAIGLAVGIPLERSAYCLVCWRQSPGRRTDSVIGFAVDAIAVPVVVLAIAASALFSPGVAVVIALTFSGRVSYQRVVRAQTKVLLGSAFVEASRSIGATGGLREHLLPNAIGPVIVIATQQVAAVILSNRR